MSEQGPSFNLPIGEQDSSLTVMDEFNRRIASIIETMGNPPMLAGSSSGTSSTAFRLVGKANKKNGSQIILSQLPYSGLKYQIMSHANTRQGNAALWEERYLWDAYHPNDRESQKAFIKPEGGSLEVRKRFEETDLQNIDRLIKEIEEQDG